MISDNKDNQTTLSANDGSGDANKALDFKEASVSELSLYVVKKTEKIAQALYLLTNYLSLEEPFRRNVREKALALVDELYYLQIDRSPNAAALAQLIETKFTELEAILNVGVKAGLLSDMNFNVLKREMSSLQSLSNERLQRSTTALNADFFATKLLRLKSADHSNQDYELPFANSETNVEEKGNESDAKPQPVKERTISPHKDENNKPESKATESPISSSRRRHGSSHLKRRDKILGLFSKQTEIDINDVASVIEGCSQKTMQRELKALVNSGILEKHGKRRWSTYTLADGIKLDGAFGNGQ